jgi:hypothetical protein
MRTEKEMSFSGKFGLDLSATIGNEWSEKDQRFVTGWATPLHSVETRPLPRLLHEAGKPG